MEAPSILKQSRQVLSISDITSDLKGLIEDNFHSLWLVGEISNYKTYASGHHYFTLKDEKAQISAVMFKGMNRRLKFEPEDGMKVVVHGRISVYEPRGNYQLIADAMEPEGIGSLQLAFDKLKKKLEAEGLFDPSKKKPIPTLPKTIGVITSLHGAAIHDIKTVLKRRFPNIEMTIFPVKVQGEGSAEEIALAINTFSQNPELADVLIIGRGGGSLEDLWAFNEEIVAKAISQCPIPLISAVGHETDFSIADFVADIRAATPSAAAELAVPVKSDLVISLLKTKQRLSKNILERIKSEKDKTRYLKKSVPTPQMVLDRLVLRLSDLENQLQQNIKLKLSKETQGLLHLKYRIPSPESQFSEFRAKIRKAQMSLIGSTKIFLQSHRHHLEKQTLKLDLLAPSQVLTRGYTMTKSDKGQILTSSKQVKPGDGLQIVFHDGVVQSTCKNTG